MKTFYDFLIQNQSFIAVYFPIILSTISLVLSVYSIQSGRKRLIVDLPNQIAYLPYHGVYCTDENGDYMNGSGAPEAFHIDLNAVNVSPQPIGYFDMFAFDADTHLQFPILFKDSIDPVVAKGVWKIEDRNSPRHPMLLQMPETWTGVFPANTSTHWDIICLPPAETKTITFTFRVAMRKPLGMKCDPVATNESKRFLYFSHTYDISGRQKAAATYKPRPDDFTSLEDLARHDKGCDAYC